MDLSDVWSAIQPQIAAMIRWSMLVRLQGILVLTRSYEDGSSEDCKVEEFPPWYCVVVRICELRD